MNKNNIYDAENLFIKNKIEATNLAKFNVKADVDFHIHSTNSDGIFNISEITEMALCSNTSHIIITDHNTILNGYKELSNIKYLIPKDKLKINIGVEVACKFFDTKYNTILKLLCKAQTKKPASPAGFCLPICIFTALLREIP